MKLDLEYKDEKITALTKELEEMGTGNGATGEEVAALKRQRIELEMRLKDQVRARLHYVTKPCDIGQFDHF